MKKTFINKNFFFSCFIAMSILCSGIVVISQKAYAGCRSTCACNPSCCGKVGAASKGCTHVSTNETDKTMKHITDEFTKHKEWMRDEFFRNKEEGRVLGALKALQLMTTELTTVGMQYVSTVGMYFDAKHQLETQRLFQTMTAKAHKDYHPTEGLCDFGTSTRSLASSNKIATLALSSISNRALDRQTLGKDTVAFNGNESDKPNRLIDFIKNFCDKNDNGQNLGLLCKKSTNTKLLFNRDIDFTKSVSGPLTLDLDLKTTSGTPTNDERSLFALMNNLFGHETFPKISQNKLVNADNSKLSIQGFEAFLDQRALMAKRSVAINSIASIAALKSKGDTESRPFLYAVIKEMGIPKTDIDQIKSFLGEEPSYHAQMEVLTKILYQNPDFYTELMDKPVNVARKEVTLQAADLMQKRDAYRSLLRSEAVIATMLETALMDEQDNVINNLNAVLKDTGRGVR